MPADTPSQQSTDFRPGDVVEYVGPPDQAPWRGRSAGIGHGYVVEAVRDTAAGAAVAFVGGGGLWLASAFRHREPGVPLADPKTTAKRFPRESMGPDELVEMRRLRAEGKTVGEIAAAMGRPSGTINRRLWEDKGGRKGARARRRQAETLSARTVTAEERLLRTLPAYIDLVSDPPDVIAAYWKIVTWCRGRTAEAHNGR